jgi:hypothetical protein
LHPSSHVAELGEMLPKCDGIGNHQDYCNYVTRGNKWQVEYFPQEKGYESTQADTEADARAKMLIYLGGE